MHKEGMKSKKPAGQRHMQKKSALAKPKAPLAKNTMGMGKSKMRAKGTMGKNQSTGDGGASDF